MLPGKLSLYINKDFNQWMKLQPSFRPLQQLMDASSRWGFVVSLLNCTIQLCPKWKLEAVKSVSSCRVMWTHSTFFFMCSRWVKLCRAQYSRERETKACTTQTEGVRAQRPEALPPVRRHADTQSMLRLSLSWCFKTKKELVCSGINESGGEVWVGADYLY